MSVNIGYPIKHAHQKEKFPYQLITTQDNCTLVYFAMLCNYW